MQARRGLPYGLALVALAILAILGWTRTTPASAQQEAPPAFPPGGPPRTGRPMMMGPASIAAAGSYVYVLRGNTIYQLNANDLSVNNQKALPAPTTAASSDEPQVQAASLQCPICKMQMTAVKTASNTTPVKINGQTWYCCAGCDMSSIADKP